MLKAPLWSSHIALLGYHRHTFTKRNLSYGTDSLCRNNSIFRTFEENWIAQKTWQGQIRMESATNKSSGVSHSDGSCVLGRIHSDVSSIIPKKVYHIVTDNFVNLLHISYAWLYKTECWGRKFHAFSFNSHRNCKIFMTNFNFMFDTICVPYIFRKSIFGWNCDHGTPLCDTPLLEDTPLCDTPDEIYNEKYSCDIATGQWVPTLDWSHSSKLFCMYPILDNVTITKTHQLLIMYWWFSPIS